MVNKYIVECPHCKVRFFVTDDLLATANGALRCGFCLHVFQGSESIVYEAMGNMVSTNPPQSDVTVTKQDETSSLKSPEIVSQDDYSEEYWREVVQQFSSFSTDSHEIEQTLRVTAEPAPTETIVEVVKSSESVDSALLTEVDRDITDYLDTVNFDYYLQLDEQELVVAHNKDVDKYVISSVIASANEEQVALGDVTASQEGGVTDLSWKRAVTAGIPVLEDDNVVRDIYGNSLKIVNEVDFETSTKPIKLVNKVNLVWAALSVLAILLLVAQYLHFAVPRMAQDMADRAWAEKICSLVFCQLPIQVDVDKIKTDRLVVRNDPNHLGALLVDSIIYNTANFSQPYPIIELRFSNLNGQTVASRRFLPDEYLNDETLEVNQLPSNMPVYISFQIIDPGEEATGYSLHYYPAPVAASSPHSPL